MLLTAFGKKACSGLVAFNKPGRMMKLTTSLLLMLWLISPNASYAQNITISVENASLETAFLKIQEQSAYRFVYTNEQLSDTRKVSISVTNATLGQVLPMIFKDQPLTYTVEENFIIVQKKAVTPKVEIKPVAGISMSGTVLTEEGQPLIGATIAVKGGKGSTKTDE